MQNLVSESLQLVGDELAVTFNDVRLALEKYADGGADPQSIDRCVNLLHTANGVLRLTETYGASLLTEEMEGTCRHLGKMRRQDGHSEEAVEALSRAAVQLPAYVELIMHGGRDIPLVLLPLLNDLRAARGRPLLSESTLLLNASSADTKSADIPDRQISGENICELCKQLRPRFQLALLGWIKGTQTEENLKQLAEVAERLERAAVAMETHQLWWVVGGVIEALLEHGIETSVSMKRLMGQADREIKRLSTMGESQYSEQPPTELVNNLLYYIARSNTSGPRVGAIREVFNLSDLIPGDSQVEIVRENLAAPSVKLMQTVAEAIRDDLARVKDVLDIYVRTGMEHIEELAPQIELLKKIGDTLGVLGLGEMREIIQTKRQELQNIIETGSRVDESTLVNMASALLSVEDQLDEQLLLLIRPDAGESKEIPKAGLESGAIDSEYDKVVRAVMREAIVNLARVKDAVIQVLERPEEGAVLDAVPQQLGGIKAGLLILEKDAAAPIVDDIGEYVGELIQQGYEVVNTQPLDFLADAIVSLEYYMETIQAGRSEPIYMLDNARRCLAALRDRDKSVVAEFPETALIGPATPLEMLDQEPTVVAVDRQPPAEIPVIVSGEGRPDPELIELFIEEAGEEIEALNKYFVIWDRDENADDALTTIRRSFHTLKGSGRMVGAELIGQFCWTIEDMLNRVINGTLERRPAIVDCLRRAIKALPELLEQLEVGTAPVSDIQGLTQQAEALAKGRPDEVSLAASDAESETSQVLDPVLIEILTNETSNHLAVIKAFVEQCRDGAPPFHVTEEVYRACHTLHGSVTMAKAEPAVKITQPLNQMIRHAYDYAVPIDERFVSTCADTVAAMEMIIDRLSDADRALPDTAGLQIRLQALDEEIEAWAALAETEEAGEETVPPDRLGDARLAEVEEDHEIRMPAPISETIQPPEFDTEIAAIFSEEAAEILEGVDAALSRLSDGPVGETILADLQRYLHTLKGGARMAGLLDIGDLSHDLETFLVRMASGQLPCEPGQLNLVQASVDELHRLRDQIERGVIGTPPPALLEKITSAIEASEPESFRADAETPRAAEVDELPEIAEQHTQTFVRPEIPEPAEERAEPPEEELEAPERAEPQEEAIDEPSALPGVDRLGQLARDVLEPAMPESGDLTDLIQPPAQERREYARVDPVVLENLLNAAGEVSIFHSRLNQQLSQFQFNLEELDQTVVRLRGQLRGLEMATEAQILYQYHTEAGGDAAADPLKLERYSKIQQLSRALAETATDVGSIKDLLQNLAGDTEALMVQQARTATELQDGLMRTRMVPFQQHAARLARLVRQMAAEQGKQAELTLEGAGEIDRHVLEKMVPPLEHMIRNAVIHGIESPAGRQAADKPMVGTVAIKLRRDGAQMIIEIVDDGRGIDVSSIRRKAIDIGLVSEQTELTDQETLQFILRPGFSTADRLTQAAGRGVGMDVVASEVAKLGGTLQINSRSGIGTTFLVRLPFTLAVTQALIVRVASELYALPLPTVEGIIRISRAELEEKMLQDEPTIDYGGQVYQLRHLGVYLGLGRARISLEDERIALVLVRAGSNSAALLTDEMLDSREIVVKPVAGQLASIRGISGATILGDGQIVVILDVGALVRSPLPPAEATTEIPEQEVESALALVVDDSITMRRVTQRLLERNGMRVITAKDGVEAIGMMREHPPDIILLDVEMPRMDGYEFAKHIRNDPKTEGLPIIMITSRVSDEHKARAIELGVNDYLGKPYQESALLDAVNYLLKTE
jgi:chemosensory pili system protein ChpA (sensor histidine kinase/response regulator)